LIFVDTSVRRTKKLCKLGQYKARMVCGLKDKMGKTNPHTTEELRNNINGETSTIGRRKPGELTKIQCTYDVTFRRIRVPIVVVEEQ